MNENDLNDILEKKECEIENLKLLLNEKYYQIEYLTKKNECNENEMKSVIRVFTIENHSLENKIHYLERENETLNKNIDELENIIKQYESR